MVLRYVLGRTDNPAAQAERFKTMASGAQLIAIGLLVASIIASTVNPAVMSSISAKMSGGVVAAVIELLAWHITGYAVRIGAQKGENGLG